MQLYRKSGLLEDVLTFLAATERFKNGVQKTRQFMDAHSDDAMKHVDQALNMLLNAIGTPMEEARRIAKAALKKGLEKSVEYAMYPVDKTLELTKEILSFDDLLAILSNEEDIVSIKATSFEADMFKARNLPPDTLKTIYRTTVEGMSDAVNYYYNAPRAKNSTHLMFFIAVPSGIGPYIVRQVKRIGQIAKDPVFKGFGIDSFAGEDGFMGMLNAIGNHFKDGMEDAFYKEKPLMFSPPKLQKKAKAVMTVGKRSFESKINSYNWRIESKLSPNPLIPVNTDQARMIRFRIIGDSGLKFRESPEDYTVREQGDSEGNKSPLFSTQLMGGMKKTSVQIDLVKDLFDVAQPYEVFKEFIMSPDEELKAMGEAIMSGKTELDISKPLLMIEYWNYEIVEGKTTLTTLDDARIVDMNPPVKDEEGAEWVGLSLGGLGSYLDFLDELSEQIKNMIKELIDTLIKLEDFLQSTMNDVFEMIMRILQRVAKLIHAIFEVITGILRVVLAFDIRYALFHGSYTDIPSVWKMIRADYKLVEPMGNTVMTLLINCKGSLAQKVTDKLEEVVDRAEKTADEAGVLLREFVVPGNIEAGIEPVEAPAGTSPEAVQKIALPMPTEEDAPNAYISSNINELLKIFKADADIGGMHYIKIPDYKGD